MLVVNLFGAPGVGKSTLAADIFATLKRSGKSVELVTEVAKDLCWSEDKLALADQLYVAGQQNHRLFRLKDKVDIVVTDAPLLVQSIYYTLNSRPCCKEFEKVIHAHVSEYDNLNFLILPSSDIEFESRGRIHSRDDQSKINSLIISQLRRFSEEYHEIDPTSEICMLECLDKIYARLDKESPENS